MAYPSPPWTLTGFGFQTIQLLEVDRVSSLIPSQLEIVSVLPGKTLGGIYVAAYGDGSALIYNELIVVNAIVRHGGKIGAWISHIYVDLPDSVAGGREIWGLPKELAQFQWELGSHPSVCVRQENEILCQLNSRWQVPAWTQPLSGLVFSELNSTLMMFEAKGQLKWHLAGTELQIPSESPFAWLQLGKPLLSVYVNPLQIVVNAPVAVEEKFYAGV